MENSDHQSIEHVSKYENKDHLNAKNVEFDLEQDFEDLENLIHESTKNITKKDEDLDDEDLFLIAQNTGIELKRHKRRRVLLDDDSDGNLDVSAYSNTRQTDEKQLRIPFSRTAFKSSQANVAEDDLDDFIVDDPNDEFQETGNHASKLVQGYHYTDFATKDAQEIFGSDFDYEDLEGLALDNEDDANLPSVDMKALYEPTDIAQLYLTQRDTDIRVFDSPEAFQRRGKPILIGVDKTELLEEAAWIYRQGFTRARYFSCDRLKESVKLTNQALFLEKILSILEHLRNDKLDVPFIQAYRRESFVPHLDNSDIWTIFDMDNEWMSLKERRKNLTSLMVQMRSYQKYFEKNNDVPSPINLGETIHLSGIDLINKLSTFEEIKDHHENFSFYFMPSLKAISACIHNFVPPEELKSLKLLELGEKRTPEVFDHYAFCKKNNLEALTAVFGISAMEFGENMKENYPKHIARKSLLDPKSFANAHVGKFLTTPEAVLSYATKLWALELAHDPLVHTEARSFYLFNATISCQPTTLGLNEIDSIHPYIEFKYLRHKPIATFTPDNYLKLVSAESEGLLKFTIEAINKSGKNMADNYKPLLEKDEYGAIVQEWNKLRFCAMKMCFDKYLIPYLEKELKNKLYSDAQKYIINSCAFLFATHLNVSPDPVKADSNYIFGVSLPPFRTIRKNHVGSNENDGVCAVILSDGTFIESFIVNSVIYVSDTNKDDFLAKTRQSTIDIFISKVKAFKPVAIVFNLDRKDTIRMYKDFNENILSQVDSAVRNFKVEVVNNLVPNLAAKSDAYSIEFPDTCIYTKQAISAARYSIDYLLETAQLFENQEDVVSLVLHPLHRLLSKEILFNSLTRVLIEFVNSTGIDINRCRSDQRYSNLLKYISGLGPSKAAYIITAIRNHMQKLHLRSELITVLHVGPNVFVNCSGFLKFSSDIESEDGIEPLDNTRIHPEAYDLARKLVECVYNLKHPDISTYIECMVDIMSDSKKIYARSINSLCSDLSLDDSIHKEITIEEIRTELSNPFADKRPLYRILSEKQLFWILATNGLYYNSDCLKDPNCCLVIGNVLPVTITGFVYRSPPNHSSRHNFQRDESTNQYLCPYCFTLFADSNDVLRHIDKTCKGSTVGVKVRLESGIYGFISRENFPGDTLSRAEDHLHVGVVVNAKVLSVNQDKASVDLSLRSIDQDSSVFDIKEKYRDSYFDIDAEKRDLFKEATKKELLKNRVIYHKKLIVHPLFKNITFEEAESILYKEQNDCIIRPSSKGVNHLGVSIRIADGIVYHADVREEDKPNDFSLGKKLWINGECYEDLDEIHARYVVPFLSYFKQLFNHKCYFFAPESDSYACERELKKRFGVNCKRIHYLVSLSLFYPGKIYLAFLLKSLVKIEYITVTNHGYRIQNTMFDDIDSVICWFKNRKDPVNPQQSASYTPHYDKYGHTTPNYPQSRSSSNVHSTHHRSPVVKNWDR
ncbi:hypothetical protein MXB_3886 [Myxobolus squamalis]|nr:hypothetical protein MXB_3886 [Myxobolus squamalis]